MEYSRLRVTIRMNDHEREMWVNNDEGLYRWWKSERGSLRQFVRKHREELTDIITKKLDTRPV